MDFAPLDVGFSSAEEKKEKAYPAQALWLLCCVALRVDCRIILGKCFECQRCCCCSSFLLLRLHRHGRIVQRQKNADDDATAVVVVIADEICLPERRPGGSLIRIRNQHHERSVEGFLSSCCPGASWTQELAWHLHQPPYPLRRRIDCQMFYVDDRQQSRQNSGMRWPRRVSVRGAVALFCFFPVFFVVLFLRPLIYCYF